MFLYFELKVIEMLTGRTPWWNMDASVVHLHIACLENVVFQLPSASTEELKLVIEKMLVIGVEGRPTADELLSLEPFNSLS
jgi:hypothetical protein